MRKADKYVLFFSEVNKKDGALVGGKNSSLGEMYNQLNRAGIRVPDGFAVTAKAYYDFIQEGGIKNKIAQILRGLDTTNVADLQQRGKLVRELILSTDFSEKLKSEICLAYQKLSKKNKSLALSVAVRSSATAEDLPIASFAGQLESYLNVRGEKNILDTVRECFASLFTDRAISYRQDQKFPLWRVAISVGVQRMVRSDKAGSGVMFTLEPESGFKDLVVINASWGLGENVVKGRVTPDEYYVYKKTIKQYKPIIKKQIGRKEQTLIYSNNSKDPTKNIITPKTNREKFVLDDKEILLLARWGSAIETHYKRPMDIEWAKDGIDKKLYIVQARPETIHGVEKVLNFETYSLLNKSNVILSGVSVGSKIAAGRVHVISSEKEIKKFKDGDVLVARATDPSWEPIMKKAAAIVTDTGGRTCHAAIVSRELGVPCVVGTKEATQVLKNGQEVTVDCAAGVEGVVYNKILKIKKKKINLKNLKLPQDVDIMMNVGNPDIAFESSFLPHRGVGLARLEFIISNYIKVHPLALINYTSLSGGIKEKVAEATVGYPDKKQFFIDKLAEGIAQIAGAFAPYEVIVRFSDFKSNEYRALIGGSLYEPEEANPMIGWRGASRYYDPKYRDAFILELRAIKKVINEFGLNNVSVMIPFCRTVEEAKEVLRLISNAGLKRSKTFRVFLMCELPVNIILAKEFLSLVDGYSIGSNDLTQLTLGVDRDSSLVSHVYNEFNPAVINSIKSVIETARKMRKKIGFCGQAPSDFPEFARFLVKNKISSISLTPDSIINILNNLK